MTSTDDSHVQKIKDLVPANHRLTELVEAVGISRGQICGETTHGSFTIIHSVQKVIRFFSINHSTLHTWLPEIFLLFLKLAYSQVSHFPILLCEMDTSLGKGCA